MKSGLYRVAMAAELAGLSPHTLRVWERRHGPFATGRSRGGNRLYGDGDVERLALLKKLTDAGHAIGAVAALARGELDRLAASHLVDAGLPAATVARAALRTLIDAALALDARALDQIFSRAVLALSPRELIELVVSPLLLEVGCAWADGRLLTVHEHAVTAVIRNQLGALLRSFQPAAGAVAVVAATPEGDLHELGALGAAVLAASAGHRTLYLGASVPTADLVSAVRASSAAVVLLSCVMPAQRQLRALRAALPAGVVLLAGGPAVKDLLPLHDLEKALRRAAEAAG